MGSIRITDGLTRYQRYYRKNKEKCQAATRKWQAENPEKTKEIWSSWYRSKPENKDRWVRYNVSRVDKKRWYRARLIVEAGGKCVKCGYSEDTRVLQIDHVNGGGNIERKAGFRLGNLQTDSALDAVLGRFRVGELQLLCANCNWLKRYTNDECAPRGINKQTT